MFADIYRTGRINTFLIVARGAGFDQVPHSVLGQLGRPVFLKTRDLSDSFGFDTSQIDGDLVTQGFSIREI